MKNLEIYNTAKALNIAFADDNKLPIKLSFKIQKNKKIFLELGEEVENCLFLLYNKYGELKEDGTLYIPPENVENYNKDYNDLMEIEQNVDFVTIGIDEISDDVEITNSQMEAIMFMIEE